MDIPHIGIDLLGSDSPPDIFIPAIAEIIEEFHGRLRLTLFATPEILAKTPPLKLVEHCAAEQVIEMDESPLKSVKQKKKASMIIAMKQLAEGKIDCLVSAGNTGALMASSKLFLGMLPGIRRPALLTLLPTESHPIAVLDVGADVRLKAEDLVEFASMGIAYQKCRGIEAPTVGLLNIGREAQKGTPELRKAHQLLQNLNKEKEIFIGNIEGKEAFQGLADVLVTDGFTGNIFLKTAEGISTFIFNQLNELIQEKSSEMVKTVLGALRHRLHHAEYPGAVLAGVDKLVIKCHGDAKPISLINSVKASARLIEKQFLTQISTELASR